MPNRTREKLIDVARHLFARKGIENTTMGDIANASDRGRRTVYTYFKNKRAIYEAVIESESERMVERLRQVYSLDLPPVEKLRRFIIIRAEVLKSIGEAISFPPSASADGRLVKLSRDTRRYERLVNLALEKEHAMLTDIIGSCAATPDIDPRQLERLRVVMPLLEQGIDVTFIRNNYSEIGVDEDNYPTIVADFIINGLKAHPTTNISSN